MCTNVKRLIINASHNIGNSSAAYTFVLICNSSFAMRFLNICGGLKDDIITANRIIKQPTIAWVSVNFSPKIMAPSNAVVTGSKE